jgi:hypothetical protein
VKDVRRSLGRAVAMLLLLGLAGACDRSTTPCAHQVDLPPRNADKVSITQGIWGDVWFWSGNFQPACIAGTVVPVSRELLVHELTPLDSVIVAPGGAPFYSEIHTPLIATTQSDASGFFQVDLAPGTYSIFVREDSLFYANSGDGSGNIWPVTVLADSVRGIRFDIRYEAYE